MRILAIVADPPHPARTGYRIRCWEILRRLAARHEVVLACLHRGPAPEAGEWMEPFARVAFIPGGRTGVASIAASLISSRPHHVGTHDVVALRSLVAEESARGLDAIYAHYLYFAACLPPRGAAGSVRPLCVLDQHNLDHEVWESHATSGSVLTRAWIRRQARLVRDFERRHLRDFDLVLSVSERDAAGTRELAPGLAVEVAPNGADVELLRPSPKSSREPGTVLFTGTSAARNVEGLSWFLRECWPAVRARVPEARCLVAGSLRRADLPRDVAGAAGLEMTGPKKSLMAEFARAEVAIVPLHLGGGTKIKIFEALASGLPVVASAEAARAPCCGPKDGLLAAEGSTAYSALVARLLLDTDARSRLGRAAREHAVAAHDWRRIAAGVEDSIATAAESFRRSDGSLDAESGADS